MMRINKLVLGSVTVLILLSFIAGFLSGIQTGKNHIRESLSLSQFILWQSNSVSSSAVILKRLNKKSFDPEYTDFFRHQFIPQFMNLYVLLNEQDSSKENISFSTHQALALVKKGLEERAFGFHPTHHRALTLAIEGIERDITSIDYGVLKKPENQRKDE